MYFSLSQYSNIRALGVLKTFWGQGPLPYRGEHFPRTPPPIIVTPIQHTLYALKWTHYACFTVLVQMVPIVDDKIFVHFLMMQHNFIMDGK